ncbi:MAG: CDP-alcohol phosphatidyltransferase family protein [Pseudomonadota bacterium]
MQSKGNVILMRMLRSHLPQTSRSDVSLEAANPAVRGAFVTSLGCLLALVLAGFALFGDQANWWLVISLSAAFFVVGTTLTLLGMSRHYPHRRLGGGNVVTLMRLALTAVLFGALALPYTQSWTPFALAALALSLDGADGWLARRQGLASRFGAAFDMQVDAALALVLALLAWFSGAAPAVVILLGLPHYLFALAQSAWPWLRAPLPARFSRKVICVVQLSVLIALQAPIVGGDLTALLTTLAAIGLIWSFSVDCLWLWRNRM